MTTVLAESGIDAGVPWHYGDPMREQRLLEAGDALVDLSHRGVISVTGPQRLSWLHSLTTQHLANLQPDEPTTALILSPQGHIEHVLFGVDDGHTFWAHTEPGRAADLAAWLDRMRFMMRVEVADRTADVAVVWSQQGLNPSVGGVVRRTHPRTPPDPDDMLGCQEHFVPRGQLAEVLQAGALAGTWAYEARRIAHGVPRIGLDTDHRTIPNEIGLPGVHLDKGCYRGQETVARVHTLGRPPRRLVRLHLDGSVNALPEPGTPLEYAGRPVGFVGGSARHYELGPIALGLVKRSIPVDAELVVSGIAAAQDPLLDPEVGLHVRPRLH